MQRLCKNLWHFENKVDFVIRVLLSRICLIKTTERNGEKQTTSVGYIVGKIACLFAGGLRIMWHKRLGLAGYHILMVASIIFNINVKKCSLLMRKGAKERWQQAIKKELTTEHVRSSVCESSACISQL